MIKYFRGIRQKLAGSGHVKRYVLYALGEIVLVVIGILFALQINNWNEAGKDRQLEKEYYCKLLEDVEQDERLLDKLMGENHSRIAAGVDMLKLLLEEKPDRKKVITTMRAAVNRITFGFKPTLAAFEGIKSSGHLRVIRDSELKKQLLNYYAVINGYVDVIDLNTGTALAVYTNPNKDFFEVGFQDIESVAQVLDTSSVDLKKLQNNDYPTPTVKKQLLSEVIFYLNINTRKDELCKEMRLEIRTMKRYLEAKCIEK
jgi:hypothetical protein